MERSRLTEWKPLTESSGLIDETSSSRQSLGLLSPSRSEPVCPGGGPSERRVIGVLRYLLCASPGLLFQQRHCHVLEKPQTPLASGQEMLQETVAVFWRRSASKERLDFSLPQMRHLNTSRRNRQAKAFNCRILTCLEETWERYQDRSRLLDFLPQWCPLGSILIPPSADALCALLGSMLPPDFGQPFGSMPIPPSTHVGVLVCADVKPSQ